MLVVVVAAAAVVDTIVPKIVFVVSNDVDEMGVLYGSSGTAMVEKFDLSILFEWTVDVQ
jgi:hypothetical protein